MKRTQKIFLIAAALSVFVLSFLIGRATALRDIANENQTEIYQSTTMPIAKGRDIDIDDFNTPAAAHAENVPNEEAAEKEETEENEPTRLLFPCGNTVLKDYSESAVYSETMKDWRSHCAIDYAATLGSSVISVYDGEVIDVFNDKLLGYSVKIRHSKKLVAVYRNLDKKILVKKGDTVSVGQAIGSVGKSAAAESKESAHLHFELYLDGVTINPVSYVY